MQANPPNQKVGRCRRPSRVLRSAPAQIALRPPAASCLTIRDYYSCRRNALKLWLQLLIARTGDMHPGAACPRQSLQNERGDSIE